MSFFSCPSKKDRVDLTDEQWKDRRWTIKEIEINCALPKKMWGRQQDDRPWPLCKQFRGTNAHGPRAADFGITKKYELPIPRLVKMRGATRWMMPKNESILEISLFDDYSKVWTPDNMPYDMAVTERKPGHPNFGKTYALTKDALCLDYGPSSLQKFSDKSKLIRDPYHFSYHKMIHRREKIGETKEITGADSVYLMRVGWRWDSLDGYYVRNAVYVGLAWN